MYGYVRISDTFLTNRSSLYTLSLDLAKKMEYVSDQLYSDTLLDFEPEEIVSQDAVEQDEFDLQ